MTKNQFAQHLREQEWRVEQWEHYHEIPEEHYIVEELQ